jgi:hypothetical protein
MYEVKSDDAVLLATTPISDAYAKMAAVENALFDLTKRLDAMDAHLVDLKGGMFAELEKMAANNAKDIAYWDRHRDRLSK